MLELIAVYWASQKLRRIAMDKGRSPANGAWALLWFGGEFTGAFIAGLLGLGDWVYLVMILFAAVGAAIAFFVVRSLAPAEGWVPGMRWAGWCRKCKANVWLMPDGKCEHGHAAGAVGKLYVPAGQTQTAADPAAQPAPSAAAG